MNGNDVFLTLAYGFVLDCHVVLSIKTWQTICCILNTIGDLT